MNNLKDIFFEFIKSDEKAFDFVQTFGKEGVGLVDVNNLENFWFNSKFWEVLGYTSPTTQNALRWSDLIDIKEKQNLLDLLIKFCHQETTPTFSYSISFTSQNKFLFPRVMRVFKSAHLPQYLLIGFQLEEENKNEESLLFFKSILENIPLMVFVKDAENLRFVEFNKAGEFLIGMQKEMFIGKNDYDFFPKNEADFFTQKDREVIQNKVLLNIPEETIQTLDKGQRLLHTKKIPIYNDKGVPQYLLGISEDITDKKRIEAELQEKSKQMSSIITSLDDIVFIINEEFVFVNVWVRNQETLFLKPEEFLGKKLSYVFGKEFSSPFEEGISICLKTNQIQNIEYPSPINDEKWFEANIIKLNDVFDGKRCVSMVVKDITKRKLAELQLESIARFPDENPHPILRIDYEGKILYVNKAAKRQMKSWDLTIDNYVPSILKVYLKRAINAKTPSYYTEIMVSDNIFTVSIILVFEHSYANFYFNDITERKKAEKELQKTKELLEQTSQMARVGGWEYDALDNKIYWSPVIYEIHGLPYSFEPTVENVINFYKEGNSRNRIIEVIQKSMKDGSSYDLELQIVNVKGEEVWVRAMGQAEIVDGVCKRMFGTFQDINERKKVDELIHRQNEALHSSQEELRQNLEELQSTQNHLVEAERAATYRGRLLEAVASTIENLLLEKNWHIALSESIELLGNALSMDRVYFFENHLDEEGELYYSQKLEWVRKGISPQINNPELQNVPYHICKEAYEILSKNLIFEAIISNMPNGNLKTLLASQGIKAISIIPIFVKNVFFGFIGFDNCVSERYMSQEEISILHSLVVSLSASIQREKSEYEIKRTQEMLEQTSNISKVGGWEYNLLNNEVYWTDMTRQILEYPENYLPNSQNYFELYQKGESREKLREAIIECIETGKSYDLELLVLTGKGQDKWVRAIGQAEFDTNGECVRLFGTFQNIDEKKRLEERFNFQYEMLSAVNELNNYYLKHGSIEDKLLFDKMLETILHLTESKFGFIAELLEDEQGKYLKMHALTNIAWSPETQKMYEEMEKSGISFRNFDNLFGFAILNNQPVISNNPASDVRRGKTPHGHPPLTSFLGIPVEGELGVAGMIAVANREGGYQTSIIEQLKPFTSSYATIIQAKKEEERRKTSEKKAQLASQAKSEFLANMSHEIRTPLNGIVGFVDLLQKSKLDIIQQQYLSTVHQSANSLLEIVNDILDFSKIEAGKMELNIEKADLFELGRQVADIIKFNAHKKGLEILINFPDVLPQYIWTDPIRLKQILINLMSNSVKFTQKGEIELKVELLNQISSNQFIFRFSVRDTGIGIALENQQKIFEAFTQEDASITKKFGGTGLGITISNKLLDMMNSQLQLESELGKGSIFYFDVEFVVHKGEKPWWNKPTPLKNVLIVDDNEGNLKILEEIFLLKQIKCELALSGNKALEKLENNSFDLLLMDYQMPKMNGLDTIKKIRKKYPMLTTPIVLLTSSVDDENVEKESKEVGIHHFLLKPIMIQHLCNSLAKIGDNEFYIEEGLELKSIENQEINVLVVEDNSVNMLLAKSLLKSISTKISVTEATNGLEALEFFKRKPFDIIFMDVQMPEMNGYEATMEIRKMEESKKRVPIIALTAGTVKGEKERCLEAGMDDYLSKPIIKTNVEQILRLWIPKKEFKPMSTKEIVDNQQEGYIEESNHFDERNFKQILDNDLELMKEVMLNAKQFLESILPELEKCIKSKNQQLLKTSAHYFKGTALTMSFVNLSRFLNDLEHSKLEDEQKIQTLMLNAEKEIFWLKNWLKTGNHFWEGTNN